MGLCSRPWDRMKVGFYFMCSEKRIVREFLREEDTAICEERHKARGSAWPQNECIKLQCFKPTSLVQSSIMEVGVTFPFALFSFVIFSILL